MAVPEHLRWKKFGLFSAGRRAESPYLHFEVLWTPFMIARFESHAWLKETNWREFVHSAEVGDVFDGHGTMVVVRLRELPADYEPEDWELLRKEES